MNSRKVLWGIGIVVSIHIACAVMIVYGCRTARMEVKERGVRITGMYGVEIPFSEISSLELENSIPRVKHVRTVSVPLV